MLSSIAALAIAWLLIRRRERRSNEWVPAALVKSYLDKVDHDEREIRYKLFGEQSTASPAMNTTVIQQVVGGDTSAFTREIDALRMQLSAADLRAADLDKGINGLKTEKSGLEKKIAELEAARASGASAAPGAAAADPAASKELEDLKAKLAEYEVIEDDLANLKKFQSENKLLKEKIENLEKAMAGSMAAPKAAAPAPAAAPETVVAVAPTPAPTLSVVPPVEAAAPAADKSPKQKEDELLSEFEKMLAS